MGLEDVHDGIVVEHLAHREFVDDAGVVGVYEDAWGYPWLEETHISLNS